MSESTGWNDGADDGSGSGVRLVPRITIQAFCETPESADIIDRAAQDRRMSRAAVTTHNGGVEAAVQTYQTSSTPNLVIVETLAAPDQILDVLGRLADVCDPETKVVVIGAYNDVQLYRELMHNGVSDYLVTPFDKESVITSVNDLFVSPESGPIGRTIGFFGAKGGVGSSTIAHNMAWALSQKVQQDVLIADMDLAFGTAGLNFNQDPPNGISEALDAGEDIDEVLLDRLISKCANHVNLLTAPATLEKSFDFEERQFEPLIGLMQENVPAIFLDIPHCWNAWTKQTLSTIDEIVIVAEPDLANLRNAKNLIDMFVALRESDVPPRLIVNKVGIPKRPEIGPGEFAKSLEVDLLGQIPFDPALFGTAANNGQMLAEVSSGNKINELMVGMVMDLTGRSGRDAASRKGGSAIGSIMGRFKRKAAN